MKNSPEKQRHHGHNQCQTVYMGTSNKCLENITQMAKKVTQMGSKQKKEKMKTEKIMEKCDRFRNGVE